uniref:sphinganine-1-phosphate aldolase n=1 Tax=Wickerhamomyces ciferrii TaxID=1041607 RepID=H2DR60_WICCI|nr:sphingolipid long-chain base phosphate lyase [Wickerhamomyces ciferrii]
MAVNITGYGLIGYLKIVYNELAKAVFRTFLSLPFVKSKVDSEVRENLDKLEDSLIVKTPNVQDFQSIPTTGLSDDSILDLLQKLQNLKHSDWQGGKVSGAVYHGGDDIIKIQSDAFKVFCVANQLHPDVFPGVRKMEAEVVAMTLKLFNAPESGVGGTSSGGTESLLLACLSAKEYGKRHKGIVEPEIIIPETAHAGFDKAGYYFGMKVHHVPLDPKTYKVDLGKLKRLINKNTVLLAGSAPNFPHGIIDDIESIGALGQKYNIPVHVDCCLGSFIVSYMEKAGYELPPFDFRVPGVTSISCDTHKYGFAPKGSSIIMYRNNALREAQYYVNVDWVGGIYGSPTLAGSRPGAIIVGCWATLIKIGDEGYKKSCKDIVGAARKLKLRIQKEIPELEIIGDPLTSVISFKSEKINIYELSDLLSSKGWHLSALQKPAALHLAVTRLSVPVIDELVDELKTAVHKLRDSSAAKGDTAALYGVAGSVSTTGVVDRLVVGFLDTLYKTK